MALVSALVMLALAACSRGAEQAAPPLVSSVGPSPAEGVVTFYEERVRRDPNDHISYAGLGEAYAQLGRETGNIVHHGRAEAALRRSLEILPEPNYRALTQLAGILNTHHQFAEALPLARQAVDMRPGKGWGYAVLGDAALELGMLAEAETAYLTLAELEPGLPAYSRLARIAAMRGDLGEAVRLWTQARDSVPNSSIENVAWAHSQLAHVHLQAGETDKAKREFEASLEAFPGYIHAVAGLGLAYAAEGNHDNAIDLTRRAVETRPLPEYVIQLGDSYQAAGQTEAAEREYARVPGLYADYEANGIDTALQMADFLVKHGDSRDAVARARLAWEKRRDPAAAEVLARALDKTGDHRSAAEYRALAGAAIR